MWPRLLLTTRSRRGTSSECRGEGQDPLTLPKGRYLAPQSREGSSPPPSSTPAPSPLGAGLAPSGLDAQQYIKAYEDAAVNLMKLVSTNPVNRQPQGGPLEGREGRPGREPEERDQRTTLMLKNIPNKYSRNMLLSEITKRMPVGSFDLVYMPIDFRSRNNFGYAFVNLISPAFVPLFFAAFGSLRLPFVRSNKSCEVSFARVQGLQANVNRLIASPVMGAASLYGQGASGSGVTDDEALPVLFNRNGEAIPFPKPDAKQIAAIISSKSPASLANPPHRKPGQVKEEH